MRCCEAWKPIEGCFDTSSLLSVLISRDSARFLLALLVKTLQAREAEVSTLPWTQTEKRHCSSQMQEVDNVPGATRNLCCLSVQLLMKSAIPWKMKMTLEEDFVSTGEPFSNHARKARGIINMKMILRLVQQALDGINRTIDQSEFDDLFAFEGRLGSWPWRISLWCPTDVLVGLGSKFLFNADQSCLGGKYNSWLFLLKVGPSLSLRLLILMIFFRSPGALRPLTLCNCDCKLLTSAICRGLHWYSMQMHTSFAEMYLFQANDGQHLWNWDHRSGPCRVCAARIRRPSDWLCCCLHQCQSLLDPLCDREHWIAWFSLSFYGKYLQGQHHTRGMCGSRTRTNPLLARGVRQGCLASGFLFAMAFDPIFRWLQESIIPRIVDNLEFLQSTHCAYADDLAVASFSFSRNDDCIWHQHFVLWIPLLASIGIIANAVGFSMAPRNEILCGHGSWRLAWVPWDTYCSTRQRSWNQWLAQMDTFIVGLTHQEKISCHVCWKTMLLPKAWLSG